MARKGNGCSFVADHDAVVRSCCDDHDRDYFVTVRTRAQSDKALRVCIAKSGHPVRAWIYWVGVRAFGWYFWGKK